MSVFALFAIVYGGVALLIGLVFWAIGRHAVDTFDRSTTGRVIDMTRNAARFNREQGHGEAAIGTEGSRFQVNIHVGSRNRQRGRSGYYKVFAYTVNGQNYTRADGICYSKGLAAKWLDKEAPVYYDSSDPSNASLSNGRGFRLAGSILIPVGLALLALAAWLWLRL